MENVACLGSARCYKRITQSNKFGGMHQRNRSLMSRLEILRLTLQEHIANLTHRHPLPERHLVFRHWNITYAMAHLDSKLL